MTFEPRLNLPLAAGVRTYWRGQHDFERLPGVPCITGWFTFVRTGISYVAGKPVRDKRAGRLRPRAMACCMYLN